MEFLSDHGMWLRWIHFVAGITWIGLLWYFNFINGAFTNSLDADTRNKVIPQLMPRALWWFRWGAAFTWLSGVIYAYGVLATQEPEGTMHWITETQRGRWITLGFVYGSVMAFNVWFMIWPRQQKIITSVIKGENPPEKAGWAKTATNCSRVNTYLSFPLLFAMGAGKHAGEVGGALPVGFSGWATNAALVTVIGFVIAWICIHKVGPVAGKDYKGL